MKTKAFPESRTRQTPFGIRFHIPLTALLLLHSMANAKDEPKLGQIFADIPPQFQLEELRKKIGLAGASTTPENRARAEQRIEKLKPILKKARAAIVTGRSVFDYPGLLAHNRSTYSDDYQVDGDSIGPAYSLYVGIYLRDHEGQGAYDFRVIFDNKGIIRSVEDVVWKR